MRCACSVLATLFVVLQLARAAPTQPETAPDEEIDRQIGDMLQKLETADNLAPRDKRAVNVLTGLLGGGGGGGNFLNELNKGPTYSQLLGGGGGFNKAGLLSGFLGSSSGTAIVDRRPILSLSVGGGAGTIDEDPDLVALRLRVGTEQLRDTTGIDLQGPKAGISAHFAIPLRPPFNTLFFPQQSQPAATEIPQDPVGDDYPEDDDSATIDDDNGKLRNAPLKESKAYGTPTEPTDGSYPPEAPEPVENTPELPSQPLRSANDGEQEMGSGGASAGASFSGGAPTGGDASASAAAGGGSDSGSILSLVTPLLGSSSAGAASGGGDGASASAGASLGGASVGASASGGANAEFPDVLRETFALHQRIKSFIFRKLVQLLGSSSGSPQAG